MFFLYVMFERHGAELGMPSDEYRAGSREFSGAPVGGSSENPLSSAYPEREAMRAEKKEKKEQREAVGGMLPRYACTAPPKGFFERIDHAIYKFGFLFTAIQLSGLELDAARGYHETQMEILLEQAASQLEHDQRFQEEFGAEALGFVASELRAVPIRDVVQVIAEKADISMPDVSLNNRFSELVFYSNTAFEPVGDFNDEHKEPSTPDASWTPPSRSDAEYASSVAGIAHGGEQIFLNLSYLTKFDPESSLSREQQIRRSTRDVFYHEYMHLFGAPAVSSEQDRLLYEGLTDAMSLEVRQVLGEKIDPSVETYSAGYHYGPTFAGDLLLHLEDRVAVGKIYASYVLKDWGGIQDIVQEQFGQNVFQETVRAIPIVVSSTNPFFNEEAQTIYGAIGSYLPLEEMLSAMEPGARTRAIEDLNTRSSIRLAYVGGQGEDVSWQGVHFFYPDGAEKRFVALNGTEDRRSFSLIDYPKQVNDSHSTTGSLPVVVSLYPKGFVGGGEIYPGSRNPWE